ncbi:hypothetical protein [Priestia koreensis]|uniref:hypothetical protein n=1 Tax=Priestia koreensis TaxID=284581 RepID=UPI00301AA722
MLNIKICLPLLLVSTLLLGGCQTKSNTHEQTEQTPSEMKKEDLPKTRAFQDPFTSEFLTSTKEVKKGYYPFESKTKRYRMNFPISGVISEFGYERKNQDYELISTKLTYADQSFGSLFLRYNAGMVNTDLNIELSSFKDLLGVSGDF